jgi:hypothetical protein
VPAGSVTDMTAREARAREGEKEREREREEKGEMD